jgi:hypothetical protein
MAVSSVSIVANSLLLDRYKLSFALVRREKTAKIYAEKQLKEEELYPAEDT